MKAAPYIMLLEAASKYNILTLTTSCATSCIFCSHHQNPDEVEAYYISKLTREQGENLLEFLDGKNKIVIGESATRICEGEPFAFEYIIEILELTRAKYPKAPIQITTSGINLDEALLQKLSSLGNIELNISLNSCTSEGRKKLYGGKEHMQAVRAVNLLERYNIKFNGSIVAMPHVVGWADLEQTIHYLSDKGAATIRVFMPGYTKHTRIQLPEDNIMQKLVHMSKELGKSIKTPIIVEPSLINNLDARIEGIIPKSPASKSNIRTNDIVFKVAGKRIFSRVEAFDKLFATENPEVVLEREDKLIVCTIQKPENYTSGVVFNYDIAPKTATRIKRAVEKFSNKRCLMLVSQLGHEIISLVLKDYNDIDIRIAVNNYFGGNIMCAGLLVLQDIVDALKQQEILPEVLFIPQIMFDEKGRDLTGHHYLELEQNYNLNIILL